jgi:hypothetical protein
VEPGEEGHTVRCWLLVEPQRRVPRP